MPRSHCFWRPKTFPPAGAQPGEEWYYTNYHEWGDDNHCRHCKVSRKQSILDGMAGSEPYPLPKPPGDVPPNLREPAFYIEVVLRPHYGDEFPRLSWHCPGGFNRPMVERMKLLGRYACHRVPRVGVDVPLVEPVVTLPLPIAEQLLEAFSSGAVPAEAVQALSAAIREAS